MKTLRTESILSIGIILLLSCSVEDPLPHPCLDGNCNVDYWIDPISSPSLYQDRNHYWHIKCCSDGYFTIMGELDELHPKYVLNKTPLVQAHYDSDYWIVLNSFSFKIPIYSVLSWFTDKSYKNPISVGDRVINLSDPNSIHSPLNIAGYQINKRFCWDCPYAETLLGTYSRYTYNPSQLFTLDRQMVGDTLMVMVKTTFNTDLGPREIVEKKFDIIID